MAIIALVTMASTYVVIHLYFAEFQKLSDQSGLASNHPFRDLLNYQQMKMNKFFIILAIVNIFTILASGIWMSHRIAGPIHRMVQSLNNFSGIKTEFKIRKNDFFQELPKALNNFLNTKKWSE
jgi:magnesium-transporting ATPase (P-type)